MPLPTPSARNGPGSRSVYLGAGYRESGLGVDERVTMGRPGVGRTGPGPGSAQGFTMLQVWQLSVGVQCLPS